MSVYAKDMDGDGDMDVLSASRIDDKIAWYENDGNENFTPHTITTGANNAESVYAEDVDGDGDMDVLSASSEDDKIAWYENLMPPEASFGAYTTFGEAPFTVQFIDSSRGGRTDWLWSFGDNSTSTEQNPIHVYNKAGFFTVSLTVTGSNGSDTFTRDNYIETIPTFIPAISNDLPTKFKLYNNYPNPFNPATTIEFDVTRNLPVTLKIYDLKGREVATLVDEKLPAGHYETTFDVGDLASGFYFYHIRMGEFQVVKKMVLIR